MFDAGWFQEAAGQLDAAQAAYARVIAAAKPGCTRLAAPVSARL
jgi:hypothetical protein